MRDRIFGCNEQSLSVDIIYLELEQLFHGQLKISSQAYGGRQGGGAATFNIDDAARGKLNLQPHSNEFFHRTVSSFFLWR